MFRAGQTYEQCGLNSRGFIPACDMINNIKCQAATDSGADFGQPVHLDSLFSKEMLNNQ